MKWDYWISNFVKTDQIQGMKKTQGMTMEVDNLSGKIKKLFDIRNFKT